MSYRRGGYWYRSRRAGDRVTTEYLGRDEIAGAVAEEERGKRRQAQMARKAQAEREARLDERSRELSGLTASVLEARGYHLHRGQWRRRRMAKEIASGAVDVDRALELLDQLKEQAERYGIRVMPSGEASERALQADQAYVSVDQQLDRLESLTRQPDLSPEERLEKDQLLDLNADVWLGRLAERAAVPDIADPHGGTLLAYDGKVRELSRSCDGALEKALVRHAALCAVHFDNAARMYKDSVISARSIRIQDGLYWEKRLNGAQLRFLRAAKALARIRRLARPSLQVNIGQKQVNVAGLEVPNE